MTVHPGIDMLHGESFVAVAQPRVGVVTNAGGDDRELRSTHQILHESEQVNLVGLLAPEHGMYATQPDSEHVEFAIDVVAFDVQDNGVRYYTYLWTRFQVIGIRFHKNLTRCVRYFCYTNEAESNE